ncbi:MAG TPA: dihydrofolate reductase family protein, partial [Bacillota bacterium]|nr:dihydrofolate reductase family protein [Bacillota bacterium]
PLDARVINPGSRSKLLLATTAAAPPDKCRALQDKGVEVLVLPSREGRVSLEELMRQLGERKVTSLLVEGGGTLNYSLLEAGLVDKLYLFIAPLIIGGKNSPTPFAGEGAASLNNAWRLERVEIKQFDQDLLVIGYPRKR